MELPKGIIMGIENLEGFLKGILALITIAMYSTVIRKSKAIKTIIMLLGFVSFITLLILLVTKNSSQEMRGILGSPLFFCIVAFLGIKGTEGLKEIDEIVEDKKYFKKIDYNIKGKNLTKKELEKIKDNLYNYFRFFEFNSYDYNIGKLKIEIEKISKTIIQVDVDHTLSNEVEIYYYDIVSRYESLKNSSFVDQVYLKCDNKFSNKIKLITRITIEE